MVEQYKGLLWLGGRAIQGVAVARGCCGWVVGGGVVEQYKGLLWLGGGRAIQGVAVAGW